MSLYMEKRVDAVLDKCIQVNLVKRKEALLRINELEELKKIIEQYDAKYTDNVLDNFINLLSDSYKILGEINLRSSKLSFDLDDAENNLRLERSEVYLGESTFSSLSHFCQSNPDTTLKFINQAIWSLLPEEKVSNFKKNNPERVKISKYDDKFNVCGDRQLDLRELLDDELFQTLDFIFDGDWNSIAKFCTKAIKMQIPAETPQEDVPF